MINNVTFRLFKLSELFNISGTKTTSLDELREYGIGRYPYVTTQSTNNGVAGFYNFYTEEGNVLTIDSAVAGFCSYHEDNFSASDHVEKLVPKFKMDKNIGLYISSLINKNNYRFSYGRKANQKQIRNIEIPLPIKADNSVDWEYIYIYMQSLENGIKQQIYSNLEVIMNMISKLDTSSWKEFKVSEVFNCKTTKAISSDELVNGDTLYVTRSATNNGCSGFLQKVNSKVNEPNCITIGAEGKFAFYQDTEFEAGVKIYTLRNGKLNKYNALFLCTLLNLEVFKYSYGRARVLEKIKDENIKLPTNEDGLPDYDYMENYIRNLWGGSLKTSVPYSRIQFDTSYWKEYRIGDLFHLVNCKCANASQLENGNDISYIGAKKNGNGVMKKVKFDNDLITKGNCVIFICDGQGSVGFNNYMDEDFIGSTTLMAGYNKNLNKYNGLFITTILDLERHKFSFGRKRKKTLAQTVIKLPSLNNTPDWDYMEKYIKDLQFSDLI